jgi:uncharacterized membrane protein
MQSRPVIASSLFAVGLIFPPALIAGIVLAHVWSRQPHEDWEGSHYIFLIRTFWNGLIGVGFGIILTQLARPNLLPEAELLLQLGLALAIGVGIWVLVRVLLSVAAAMQGRAITNPTGWTW